MNFYAVLDRVVELLQSRRRVSYRALKLQFDFDDDHLDALREELLYYVCRGLAHRRARGARAALPWILASMGDAYRSFVEASSALAEARQCVERKEQCLYAAEVYRLSGELALSRSEPDALGGRRIFPAGPGDCPSATRKT